MGLLLEGGSGRGVLGIYTDGRDGAPRLLLAQTDPFLVEQGLRWYRPSLRKPVRIPGDSTVWLAWVFENEAVLRADRPTNPGDIGKTRIRESGFSWTSLSGLSNPSNGDLPRYFPVTARISSQILSLYALGEEPGSGIR